MRSKIWDTRGKLQFFSLTRATQNQNGRVIRLFVCFDRNSVVTCSSFIVFVVPSSPQSLYLCCLQLLKCRLRKLFKQKTVFPTSVGSVFTVLQWKCVRFNRTRIIYQKLTFGCFLKSSVWLPRKWCEVIAFALKWKRNSNAKLTNSTVACKIIYFCVRIILPNFTVASSLNANSTASFERKGS